MTKFKRKLTLICILHHKFDFYYVKDHQLLGGSAPDQNMV